MSRSVWYMATKDLDLLKTEWERRGEAHMLALKCSDICLYWCSNYLLKIIQKD